MVARQFEDLLVWRRALILARELHHVNNEEFNALRSSCLEITRMLTALHQSIGQHKRRPD